MHWLSEKLGTLLDWIVGDRTTTEHSDCVANRTLTLRPSLAEEGVEIGVTVTRVAYVTHYNRFWLRPTTHYVYRVLAFAPPLVKDKLDARLFQPQTYPLLCSRLLKNTQRPHLYALHAFLDQMGPFYPTLTFEL